jgi:predicted RND superfamily exporter protein
MERLGAWITANPMTIIAIALILTVVAFHFAQSVTMQGMIKALLPVLPMLVVIGWMGGVMYLGGLKYTPLTATLGALVLGIGSEYAILMMERFYEELKNVGDPFEALTITANRIGSALVASRMSLRERCGFWERAMVSLDTAQSPHESHSMKRIYQNARKANTKYRKDDDGRRSFKWMA